MPKHCLLDDDGVVLAFYDDGVHGTKIPNAAIAISDADYQKCIDFMQPARMTESGEFEEHVPDVEDVEQTLRQIVSDRIESDAVLGALVELLAAETGTDRAGVVARAAAIMGDQ